MAPESVYSLPPTDLPTPADSPVENATIGISRKLSRNGGSTRNSNRLSNIFPDNQSFLQRHHIDQDGATSEKRSSIDAFRFTSNLDNSLLQQIHALRSELEEKNKVIENLEDNLQETTVHNGVLSEELSKSKNLKKQMNLLEDESLSALEDLAKERDIAIESMGDFRRRLEISNQKLRAQQEDAAKMQELRDNEEKSWQEDKRNMDLKLHVMENRLKTMVAEMVATESKGLHRPDSSSSDYDAMQWASSKPDTFSIRSGSRPESRMSIRSFHEPRDSRDFQGRPPSRLSALHEVGENPSSLNLADELAGEEFDEEESARIDPALPSPGALPEELAFQRNRYSEDQKAREVMGLLGKSNEGARDVHSSADTHRTLDEVIAHSREALSDYADTATQTSAPSSPKISALPVSITNGLYDRPRSLADSSKQTGSERTGSLQVAPAGGHVQKELVKTAEIGIQTDVSLEALQQSDAGLKLMSLREKLVAGQADTDTQRGRGDVSTTTGTRDGSNHVDEVPIIAIHPPGSRPPTSHDNVKLPPGTKNAATSANIDLPRAMRSMSTQTIESSISMQAPMRQSSSTAISRIHDKYKMSSNGIGPKSSRRKLKSPPPHLRDDPPPASPPISVFRDVFASDNDDGPLNSKIQHGPRRPIRSASILAGFSDDDMRSDHERPANLSDDEFRNAPPIRRKLEKVKDSWRLIPSSHQTELDRIESMSEPEAHTNERKTQAFPEGATQAASEQSTPPKDVLPNTSKKIVGKQGARRVTTSSISTGPSHFQRSRTPSVPSISTGGASSHRGPPLPVPTRHSSRKVPLSASDGAASPTFHSTSYFTTRQQNATARPRSKRKTLRYSRSSAVVTEPSSPTDVLPPLPTPLMAHPPRTPVLRQKSKAKVRATDSFEGAKHDLNRNRGSSSLRTATATESVDQYSSDVIHAVTQTMIGEWMFKYVRKRKSFGVKDNAQYDLDKGAVGATRHKRWVWVLPREHAVVWSDKEPTTAHAIGGKGARKLTIQSVVDVPDTAALPKGYNATQICDRSILILTSERALKLTATSRERHYIWLTALSYISSADFNLTLVEGPALSPLPTPTRHGSIYSRRELRTRDQDHEDDMIRPSEEAAEAPQVPRISSFYSTSNHSNSNSHNSRRRNSAGPAPKVPLLPPSILHAYPSSNTNALATSSNYDIASSPWGSAPSMPVLKERSASGPTTMTSAVEGRVVPNNVFDAIGTVRMEAFIEEEFPKGGTGGLRDSGSVSAGIRDSILEADGVMGKGWTDGEGGAVPPGAGAVGGGRKRSESRGKRKDMMAYWGVSDDPFRGF